MVEPRRRDAARFRQIALIVGAMLATGCGASGTTPTSKAMRKVVVIHLGGPAAELEPSDSDVKDGFRQGGMVEASDYTVLSHDAKGDPSRVASMVEEAVKADADLIITLDAKTAPIVAERAGKVPVVFFVSGDPRVLGLGTSLTDHRPGLTGAFLPFGRDDLMPCAALFLPKAKRFGIAFNPDDRASAAHKNALIADCPATIAIETAEFRGETGAVGAVKSLLSKKVEAIILATGLDGATRSVIDEARRAKVPCFGFTPEHARLGAVFARTPKPRWGGFEAGRQGARVLAGVVDIAGIPFVQGSLFDSFANDKVLKELQITFPGELKRGTVHHFDTESKP
jgi:ABC-type uncharacterized transport system substrate-binding protein